MKSPKSFQLFCFALIGYTLAVILWGAWVRISGSGDGCGDHWPLCHGQLMPEITSWSTWIEKSHRLSTGLYGFLVLFLLYKAYKIFPSRHPVRFWAWATLIFTLIEALIGAKIVLFGLVAQDDSWARALIMALHLVNTFFLSASLVFTCFYSISPSLKKTSDTFNQGAPYVGIGFLTLGATGAFAALASTLFPSESLLIGLQQDFAQDSHFLLRLRILHPILAIVLLIGSFYWARQVPTQWLKQDARLHTHQKAFLTLLTTGFLLGLLTLALLSPLWLKLTHLLWAHLIWISWLFFVMNYRRSAFTQNTH